MVRHSSVPTWEVHPEVSFALMLGRPARSAKTTWAGMKERVAALEREGLRLGSPGDAGDRAGVDDVLRRRSGTPAGIRRHVRAERVAVNVSGSRERCNRAHPPELQGRSRPWPRLRESVSHQRPFVYAWA